MNGESYDIDSEVIPSEICEKEGDEYSMQEVKADFVRLHRKIDDVFTEVNGKLDAIWRHYNIPCDETMLNGENWQKPLNGNVSKGAMSGKYNPESLPLPAASSLSSKVLDTEIYDNGDHGYLSPSHESAATDSVATGKVTQVTMPRNSVEQTPQTSRKPTVVENWSLTSNRINARSRRKLFQSLFAKDGTALKKTGYLRSGLPINASTTDSSTERSKMDYVSDFLEEPESSLAAFIYSKIMSTMIMASCVLNFSQTVKPPYLNPDVFVPIEMLFDAFLLGEVTVRFMATRNKVDFFSSIHNCIDCMSSGPPLILRAITQYTAIGNNDTAEEIRYVVLCVSPVFRMLKMLRRWDKFHLLMYSGITLVGEVMPVLIVMLFMMAISFASLIYFVEPDIEALPTALWFTVITMSTVGYGDTVPESTSGKVITIVLVISSALYMAVPLGIAGNAFSKVWDDRDWLQLVQHTRDRLTLNGYHASDIPALFQTFGNDAGEISLDDFTRMISEMGLGIREDRILLLFFAFDSDNSGNIDAMEFIRAIFPTEFARMYGRRNAVLLARQMTRAATRESRCTRRDASSRILAGIAEKTETTRSF